MRGSLSGPGLPTIVPATEHPACTAPSSLWQPLDVTKLVSDGPPLRADYYEGLARRAELFAAPITADGKPVAGGDVERVREVVFEEVRFRAEQPEAVSASGDPCSGRQYAGVLHDPVVTDGALVTNEYPSLAGLTPEERLWVRTHELGHAIDAVVQAVPEFNKLPLEERMAILKELEALRAALAAKGHTVSYSTGKELFANLYAAMLLEPDLAEKLAPNASKFFGGLVNDHPELSRILAFR